MAIQKTGTTITYLKNGVVFYTSTVPSSGKLLIDTLLYNQGNKIEDAKFVGSVKAVPDAVNDVYAVGGDEQVVLTWTEPANNGEAITSYTVQYGTVAGGEFNQAYNDDNVAGATITGLTNDVEYQFRVVATNSIGPSNPGDYDTATPLEEIIPYNVTWIDAVNVTVNGNSITKTSGGTGFNSGAASLTTFARDGGVDFSVSQTNAHILAGLAYNNPNANYTSINYAIYPAANQYVYVYENGVYRGVFGTYATGDRFVVERVGTTVFYRHNGNLIYTSTVPSSGIMMVDSSIYNVGAILADAKIIGNPQRRPDKINDLAVQPGFRKVDLSWSIPANNGGVIMSYEVHYGTVSSGVLDQTFEDDDEPGATITGLTPGEEYQFRVVAINSLGASVPSNLVSATIHLGTHVSGTIYESQTWTLAESPYIIVGSTYFAEGYAELTIEPGVQVLFDGYYSLTGEIYAQGTPGNPIVFTSNAENPQPGDWAHIELRRNSVIRNTIVEYADTGLYDAEPSYTPTLEYNLIRNNVEGLDFARGTPIVQYNTIVNNNDGIRLQGDMLYYPIGHYNHNLLYNNSSNNFRANVGAGIVVDAENNWWGTLDEYEIEESIFDSNDLWCIHVVVDYVPYLGDPLTSDITKTTVDYLSYSGIADGEFTLGHVYKGGRNINGVFGQGWQFNYFYQLEDLGNGTVNIITPQSQVNEYIYNSSLSKYIPPKSQAAELVQNVDDTWTLTLARGETYQFDEYGKVTGITDRHGNEILYAYDQSDRLETLTINASVTVDLMYDVNGLLETIEDNNGAEITFTYDSVTQDLLTLVKVGPNGFTRAFTYDINHNLVSMTDGQNTMVYNTYNTASRLTGQEAGAAEYEISYGADSVTLTQDQDSTEYVFNPGVDGVLLSEEAAEGKTTYVYNKHHLLASITYPDNSGVKFVYDEDNTSQRAIGNVLSVRMKADMAESDDDEEDVWFTMTYESTYNLLGTITDKNENTVTLNYDANWVFSNYTGDTNEFDWQNWADAEDYLELAGPRDYKPVYPAN